MIFSVNANEIFGRMSERAFLYVKGLQSNGFQDNPRRKIKS